MRLTTTLLYVDLPDCLQTKPSMYEQMLIDYGHTRVASKPYTGTSGIPTKVDFPDTYPCW